jgi:hypothetical protein
MDEGLRMLLMEAMSQYPAQSSNPVYHQSDYPDDYCKVHNNNLRLQSLVWIALVSCDSWVYACFDFEIMVILVFALLQFFLPGLSRVRAKGALRIYNKIGRAYGFTIDNSWVLLSFIDWEAVWYIWYVMHMYADVMLVQGNTFKENKTNWVLNCKLVLYYAISPVFEQICSLFYPQLSNEMVGMDF